MKVHTYLILVLGICLSCQSNEKNTEHSYKLVKDSLVIIESPDSIIPFDVLFDYWDYNENRFSYLSQDSAEDEVILQTYDFTRNDWQSVRLSKEGPDQMYSKGQFKIRDSAIILFPEEVSKIITLRSNGQKISEFQLSDDWSTSFMNSSSPYISEHKGNLLLDLSSYSSLDDEQTFENVPILGLYDLEKTTLEKLMTYPEEFHDRKWSTNQIIRNSVITDHGIYVNFSKSPYMYKYDLKGNLVTKKKVSTDKIKVMDGKFGRGATWEMLKYEEHGYYSNLLFDKYRNVFYRIGNYFDVNGEPFEQIADMQNVAGSKTLVIFIFDENLNIIGEEHYNYMENQMIDYVAFVNEDGLFLLTSNPDPNIESINFAILKPKLL